ncbi:MAG: hypothetical protein ABI612_03610 [Betaproteobacteria bacterium]
MMVTAAKIFIVICFVAAAINMWIGVSRAGYFVAEERVKGVACATDGTKLGEQQSAVNY